MANTEKRIRVSGGWRRTAALEQVRGREGRDGRQGPLVELRVAVADRDLPGAQGPRRLGHGERSRLELLLKLLSSGYFSRSCRL